MKKKAVLFLVVLLTIGGFVQAEPVHFDDSQLKAAVEQALGKTDPNSDDMLKLTHLDAPNKGIESLVGLEYATNLAWLGMYNNHISDLSPLAGLTNLTMLSLPKNHISNLSPLVGLSNNLKTFNLSDNQISNLSPLAGLTNLTYLDLSSNQISNLSPLAGLANLTWLNLNSNQNSNLSPLAGLSNLTTLGLYSNHISDLSPLAYLSNNLIGLNLGTNQISNLSPLAGFINLNWLELSSNEISDVSPLAGMTNLTSLKLDDNHISDISPLVGMTNLTWLALGGNQLSDISPLAGLTNNQIGLKLYYNQISDVSPLAGLTNLTWLDLCRNSLNCAAYCKYLPMIQANNPGLPLCYDSNTHTDCIPAITQLVMSPENGHVLVGQEASFTITVSGAPPLSYQWYKDDQPISNSDNNVLTISSVQSTDAGDYNVVVTNDCGSATSNSATLTVNGEPPHTEPVRRKALIIVPFYSAGLKGYSESLKSELNNRGFDVKYLTNENSDMTIENLAQWLKSSYDIIHFTSHGSQSGIAVESFDEDSTANLRLNELMSKGYGSDELYNGRDDNANAIVIGITGEFIRNRMVSQSEFTLVYFESCWMGANLQMAEAFREKDIGCYVGFDRLVLADPVSWFWGWICTPVGTTTKEFYENLYRGDTVENSCVNVKDLPSSNKNNDKAHFGVFGNEALVVFPQEISSQSRITQGETKTNTVSIDSTVEQSQFFLKYDSNGLDFTLRNPDGITIDSAYAANDPNITYGEEQGLKYYLINVPLSGQWQMNIEAVNVPPEGQSYNTTSYLITALTLMISTNNQIYDLNEPISLTAQLLYDSNSYSDANVTARIERPDGNETITLYDDGLHNDGNSNDGNYANTYTNTAIEGQYNVAVTASGWNPFNEPFVRETSKIVQVMRLPDLIAADLQTNDELTQGEITLTATIRNNGTAEANDINVEFYDVNDTNVNRIDPNIIIARLEPNETNTVSVVWNATYGRHQIFVVIDSNNAIAEKDETNNYISNVFLIDCFDFNFDGRTDFADFATLANRWLDTCAEPVWCDNFDIDRSGQVDIQELTMFAQHWLW